MKKDKDVHIDELDREFAKLRETKPETTFAQFYAGQVLNRIDEGTPHATLGPNLKEGEDWWAKGAKKFAKYRKSFDLRRPMKVIDYGCGTLRLGGHFIRFLEPGCYYGVDVVKEFLDMGKDLIGEDLVATKRPKLGLIGNAADRKFGLDFDADFVFSSAVAFHVHPDELPAYFEDLMAFARKPGARVVFDATLANEPFRYGHRGWTWPLDFYVKSLSELEFVKVHDERERARGERKVTAGRLEFRRRI